MALPLLTDVELAPLLNALPSWSRAGNTLVRTLQAPSFLDAVRLLDRVALVAEAHDHHPDLLLSYKTLTLTLSSHDAGGLTRRDTDLAAALNPLLDVVAA
jgi:4a-hydroxytetrahydrobiopterin dehydratase